MACLENCFEYCFKQELPCTLFKKRRIGAVCWKAYDASYKIQPQEYSRGSATDCILHEQPRLLWAVNANWNDDNGWNVNANSVENPNRWNADNQVFGCDYFLSPAFLAGVFIKRPLRQPPIILPIFSMSLPSVVNC